MQVNNSCGAILAFKMSDNKKVVTFSTTTMLVLPSEWVANVDFCL